MQGSTEMDSKKELPQGWKYKKMPEVVKWGSGGTPKATESLYYENGTIPWLIIGDLNDGIVKKSATKITKLGLENSSAKLIPCGTLLIAMYGSIGKLGITGFECCTNQAIAFAQKLNGVDTMYLFYYLMMIKPKLVQMGKGGTQKNISQTVLNSLQIPLPPLATQRAIVARIEELFAELDKAVEKLKTARQQLKTYKQAVLNHWLNNDDGKWEMVKLGEVADAIDPEPSHRTPKIQKDGIPFVSIKDCDYITNTINLKTARLVSKDVLTEHKERYSIKEGDFIIGKIGTIGNPVNVILPQEYALSANVVLIQPTDKINAKFLYNAFRSNIVEKQLFDGKKATTQAAFGIKKVRLIEIPLPPLAEQQRIVKEIESRLSACESMEQSIAQSLAQAEVLRQSILKKAFGGELV